MKASRLPDWLTQEYLKSRLHYNPKTGLFAWTAHRENTRAGSEAGTYTGRNISIGMRFAGQRKFFLAHRLAFLYMTGKEPSGEIDHINGKDWDNAWQNLRDVPRKTNARNQRRHCDNTSGITGVKFRPEYNHWRAITVIDGVQKESTHSSKEEAIAARRARLSGLGYTERHGK